ncbi:MAG: 7-cyano-7-deazaguanine synthase QueC [Zetaproteobacteria bacterium CG12_big_fil_rev_8_21_14_0_65_54_13]|nr:MAG: 7-cyano-7-deazaguanine synthase QueC [Zetaproteobacteria bacterium CG23_combo_of_CG06-09_8_20_14_all_54_7]PIW46244.1 MAG: 7-cyano-7-deazaguanine synthase QueC [Zetaproteobacteria bacterium CG12_big_fil_rev_8_21_14_0_65_54_13]PIX54840.1 MAG: 7-cyano-7-deazaguanine synthase QueC [Zetaproteobacteria bacterium CG_4_10_14_3_um_filter_54_28]PJA29840.1 MAG: 7-cyano-7-deazaguanine synthase QueC [Zetaproteobacteria bacterium CG_4_9_14_3_um_filter_54_145]
MSATTTHAVVLLSGGLDSSTALAWSVRQMGWHCHTVAFDYGQRHRIELEASANVAASFGVTDHRVIKVDLRAIGHSALTSATPVPKDEAGHAGIPSTYVPARNLIFLSLAAGLAEAVSATRLVIGANVVDYSGYPDCRQEFLDSFVRTALLGTKAGSEGGDLEIAAPLIQLGKSGIIALGLELGLDYSLTRSCYDPLADGSPCGHCDSCFYRRQGFEQLGRSDPLPYPGD